MLWCAHASGRGGAGGVPLNHSARSADATLRQAARLRSLFCLRRKETFLGVSTCWRAWTAPRDAADMVDRSAIESPSITERCSDMAPGYGCGVCITRYHQGLRGPGRKWQAMASKRWGEGAGKLAGKGGEVNKMWTQSSTSRGKARTQFFRK